MSLCLLNMMFSFVWPLYSFHNWVMSLIMVIDWFIGRGCSSHHSVNIRNNRLCQLFCGLINPGKNFFIFDDNLIVLVVLSTQERPFFILDDTFDCSFVVLSSQERTFLHLIILLICIVLVFSLQNFCCISLKRMKGTFLIIFYGLITAFSYIWAIMTPIHCARRRKEDWGDPCWTEILPFQADSWAQLDLYNFGQTQINIENISSQYIICLIGPNRI